MREALEINDVIVFDPGSFENARLLGNQWLYCSGVKSWRGEEVPFVSLAAFSRVPNGQQEEVMMSGIGGWTPQDLEWISIPCASTSCALVVEREGVYVKLRPLNEEYCPPQGLERVWVSAPVLEYGARVGMLRVLP